MEKSSTSSSRLIGPLPDISNLVIDGLADDVCRWQEEAMIYREMAQVAIFHVARLKRERDQARTATQALRDELRRYTATAVSR